MTDEEAIAAFLAESAPYYGNAKNDLAEGFRAGLAHARAWRLLTEDPPAAGTQVVLGRWIALAPDMETWQTAGPVRVPADHYTLFVEDFTHWAQVPEPPR